MYVTKYFKQVTHRKELSGNLSLFYCTCGSRARQLIKIYHTALSQDLLPRLSVRSSVIFFCATFDLFYYLIFNSVFFNYGEKFILNIHVNFKLHIIFIHNNVSVF